MYCHLVEKHMEIFDNIVLAPFEQGQQKKGVGEGSYQLNSLFQRIGHDVGLKPSQQFIVIPDSNTDKKWGDDYKKLYDVLKELKSYVLFGGDHSIGQSSVASSLTKVNPSDLAVIWIDAHADANTYEASISKNYHGMPLAGIVGYEKPWFEFDLTLPTQNLLYFGIRDLDEFEVKKINENGIFHTHNLQNMMQKINEIISNNPNTKFHISWDVDSLDPAIFNSTGCLAENGLKLSDVIEIISCLKDRLIALDVVEYNPMLGNDEQSQKVLCEFFNALI
jgi:arginase